MCDVPSIAVFCSEFVECFPGTASKFFLKLIIIIIIIIIIVFGFCARVCILLALQLEIVLLGHVDNKQLELLAQSWLSIKLKNFFSVLFKSVS